MSTCLTCPISALGASMVRGLGNRFSQWRTSLDGPGLGSLVVISLASGVLAMAAVTSVLSVAAPLVDLIPTMMQVLAWR